MTPDKPKPIWAPKVPKAKIQSLYGSDANGIIDTELIDDVGWALWSRCDSILTVTAAHYGLVQCPGCGEMITHPDLIQDAGHEHTGPWNDEDTLTCAQCGWQMPWAAYHQTYQGKQLFGANAVESFEMFHKAFPGAQAANEKMLLIDQLIHAFHTGLTEFGRPVAANLIEGSLKDVIHFLDNLTNGPASAAGIGDSRAEWRKNLESVSWSRLFLPSSAPDKRSTDRNE
jgi:hypothetical protein